MFIFGDVEDWTETNDAKTQQDPVVTVTITQESDQENLTGAAESNRMDNGWARGVCVFHLC